MKGDRSPDALSDAALEREIEAALAVDPSPEFTARVRARVANENAPSAWRSLWALVAIGALAATIVAAFLFRPHHLVVNRGPIEPALVESRPFVVAPQRLVPGIVPTGRPSSTASQRTASQRTPSQSPSQRSRPLKSEAVTPEVLVAADEAAALQHFLTRVRGGLVDLSTLAGIQDVAEGQPPPDIFIAPIGDFGSIAIAPVAPVAQQEGAR